MWRQIGNVFSKDMKNIGTNWVVAILICGLVLLPSLYAWFNIKASWDPYGQTDQIPIGVVNEDEGVTARGKEIDVGKSLVDTLKENDDMNWQFVDRKKAMEEVEYGNYYAVIIIPENFSERLATVISGEPEKADIEYYVNEKINAIAPKITDKGASVIVEEISGKFVSTVNGVIFDMFNQIGLEIEAELPDIKKFEEYIFTIEESLPEIYDVLNSTDKDAKEAQEIVQKALTKIPETKSMANDGLDFINQTITHIATAEERFDEIAPLITKDLQKAQSIVHEINDVLQQAESNGNVSGKIIDQVNNLSNDLNSSSERLGQVNEALTQVQEQLGDGESAKKENLEQAKTEISSFITVMETMEGELGKLIDAGKSLDKTLSEISDVSQASSEKADQFINEYTNTIEPSISEALKSVKGKLGDAKNVVLEIQNTIPKIESLLHSTDEHLGEGREMLGTVLGEFPYVQDKVKETANRIRKLEKETDLNDIIDLLKNDPEAEQGFFAEPVVLNKNEIFPIENYGTGMTPFYTVLAIWVGALLLISLLSTDLREPTIDTKEMYFGRMLTFFVIGLLQTLIVTVGDIVLLGVNASSPVWFIVFGLFISIIFMIIVYTVVSVFGDVGKAIAIVLLVLQIAGSGGTYPVVLLPQFFQAINPFLPFTYAIDLMREAVGGIVWQRAIHDILFLSLFGLAFLLGGTFLKEPINRFTKKMMESKGSRLFH